jgi:hypothetical protein
MFPLLILSCVLFSITPSVNWAITTPNLLSQEISDLTSKDCHRGPRGHHGERGHRGERGKRGHPGINGATTLGSFFSTATQDILAGAPVPLEQMNFTPLVGGISQSADFTTLTFADAGLYEISYGLVTATSPVATTTIFGLTLNGNLTSVPGSIISQSAIIQGNLISGVVIIRINSGQTLQLNNLSGFTITTETENPGTVSAYLSIAKLHK